MSYECTYKGDMQMTPSDGFDVVEWSGGYAIMIPHPPHHDPIVHGGWGNGYVGVQQGHPWWEKSYEDIHRGFNISVHGGLTWSEHYAPNIEFKPPLWWVGFDTHHSGDTAEKCSYAYVLNELRNLIAQAEDAMKPSHNIQRLRADDPRIDYAHGHEPQQPIDDIGMPTRYYETTTTND